MKLCDFYRRNFSIVCTCRWSDLEVLGSALQQYRQNHSALIRWIEETTEKQERAQAGQTDSRALSEQLAQQTVRSPRLGAPPGHRWAVS